MNNPWLALAMRIQGIARRVFPMPTIRMTESDTGSSGRLLRKCWPQL